MKPHRPLWKRLARGFGFFIAGVIGLIALLLLVIDTGPIRRLIVGQVNGALESSFTGKLVIDRVGSLGLFGLSGIDVSVFDARGKRVLVVKGARAAGFLPRIAYDAVSSTSRLSIDSILLDHVEVRVIDDGSGSPTLASAFTPRTPEKPDPNDTSSMQIALEKIQVRHVWAHGKLSSSPFIDVEVANMDVAFRSSDKGLNLELRKADLKARALPMRADPNGRLSVKLDVPSKKGAKLRTTGRFDGTVADTKATLSFALDGEAVNARFEAPRIAASAVSQRVPSLSPKGPSALLVTVEGRLPELGLEATLDSPAGQLRATATARLEPTTRIAARVELSKIDASGVLPTAPKTLLNAQAKANLELSEQKPLVGTYQLSLAQGRVGNETTPAIAIEGDLNQDVSQRLAATGAVHIDEPSAPTRIQYRFQNGPGSAGRVQVEFVSRLRDPPRLRRLGAAAAGLLSAEADWDLDANRLRGSAHAELHAVSFAPHKAGVVILKAEAEGPPDALRLTASLRATKLVLADRHYARASANVVGSLDRLDVDAVVETISSERIELAASVGLDPDVSIDAPRVSMLDREGRIDIGAENVQFGAGGLRIDRFEVTGAGTARGSARIGPGREEIEFTSDALDVPRLARSVGVKLPIEEVTVTLDAKVLRKNAALTGHLRGQVRNINLPGLRKGALDLDFEFDPKQLSGTANADFGAGGHVSLDIEELRIPRAPYTRERLANLPIAAKVEGHVKLREMLTLLKLSGVPLERAGGTIDFELHVENRTTEGERPELRLEIATSGLRLVEERPKKPTTVPSAEVARATDPRTLQEIDLDASIELDRLSGKASADLKLTDPQGVLAYLNAETELPPNWIQQPNLVFTALPVKAKLRVPRRALSSLPRIVRPKTFQGIAELDLSVEGRLPKPRVHAAFRVDRLHPNQSRRIVDVQGEALYEEKGGKISVSARGNRQALGEIAGTWQGDLMRVGDSMDGQPSPITAELEAKVDRFPMGLIPSLRERNLRGTLSGNVSLKELGRNAKLVAEIDGSRLSIGGAKLKQLSASLKTERDQLVGLVEMAGGTGSARAEFRSKVEWGNRVVPVFSDSADARLVAKRFRLESLAPLLRGSVSEVGGQLDADLTAKLDPKNTVLKGEANISDGVIQVPQIGQRFSDLNAKARIGKDEFRLEQFEARGLEGKVRANAVARLKGLNVVSAEAHVEIPEGDALPVTVEGASIGEASGRIDITYAHEENAPMDQIRVEVPKLHFELPEGAGSDVQSLAPAEAVRVGVRRKDGEFAALPVQPLEPESEAEAQAAEGEPVRGLRVVIRLGPDVTVQRGQQVEARLAGEIQQVSQNGESEMTGRIEVKGGTLDVQGKTFEIERGLVTFDGDDPANPTVTATARWDAPVGYAVYAEYAGTAKEGSLNLRSEPPLTQDEITSLILFGSPEGSVGSGSGDDSNAAMAVGVAGGTAAKGLNQALSRFTDLDVSARIDTSTGSARPEIVVQVSPRVTARITRAVGEPAPGQSPDRTFLTLEFRLRRAWSLLTRLGDRGASTVDLIWRKRY